jgi:hypothetical protein
MNVRRSWGWGLAAAVAVGAMLLPACRRKPAEVNPIQPALKVNRDRAPLGSAIEVTYSWSLEAGAKKIPPGYRAFVHFLDSHKVVLFTDDHVPTPAPESWEAGKTYSYSRTVFIPIYPYVGEAQVVIGLYPAQGRGERIVLKGEDYGLRAFKVAKIELLPQTENIFLVYKEGWHNPEPHPENPAIERTWTKKEALVSFKNPKKDVVVYLEADASPKFFTAPPVLTVTVGKAGLLVPIEGSDVFLKRIRVKAADLGNEEWVDLRLSMNQSFVPKLLTPPLNSDDRELGLLVYHLHVAEADKLGDLAGRDVVVAAPLPTAPAAQTAEVPKVKVAPAPAKAPAAKKP